MATATLAPATSRGTNGKMIIPVTRLSEPLLLEQDVVDPIWHRAMLIGFIIACFVVPGLIGYGGYRVGARGESAPAAPTVIQQTITPPPQPQQVQPPPARELTPEELDRRHSEYLRRQ